MRIINKMEECTACTACYIVCPTKAITMQADETGFKYPEIDENRCINCKKCQNVCPILNIPKVSKKTEYIAAYNKEEEQRTNSTSGGLFYLLAERIINDGGVAFGAAYDKKQNVQHVEIQSVSEIRDLQGAKYVQSDLQDTFLRIERYLKQGREVLFSGTPCQVAGLKSYLQKDYENLLTIDLVCHGVPSPKAWEAYLVYRMKQDNQPQKPEKVNLRSKKSGWSHYGYSVELKYVDGTSYTKKNWEDIYMRSFISNMIIRPSCNECHFKGVHRCSDFTLGDFWGIWDIDGRMDDDKGTSLVLLHTDKAKRIWNEISNKCIWRTVEEEDTYKDNPSLIQASSIYEGRNQLLKNGVSEMFDIIDEMIYQKNEKNESLLKRIWKRISKREKL